jgi:ferredoxin
MAFQIIDSCVNCWACEPLCPNRAIAMGPDRDGLSRPHFLIDARKCTECEGDYAEAQCAAICPVEGAILNGLGEPLNPPGSLTGIPPEQWAVALAEIRAR